jgi:hypothetical protein
MPLYYINMCRSFHFPYVAFQVESVKIIAFSYGLVLLYFGGFGHFLMFCVQHNSTCQTCKSSPAFGTTCLLSGTNSSIRLGTTYS